MGMSNSKGSGSQSGTSSSTGNSISNNSFVNTSSQSNPYADFLFNQGQWLFNSGIPALTSYEQSLTNALSNGSLSGAGIPMAQAAISQARGASAATQQGTESFLARMGGANSPFAASVLGSEAMQGNEAVAQAPVGIYQTLLGQAPGFLSSLMGGAAGAERGAAGLVGTRTNYGGSTTNDWFQQHGRSTGNNSFSGSGFNFNLGDLANAGAAAFGF